MTGLCHRLVTLAFVCLLAAQAALAQAADVRGLGRVQADGSLLVDDRVVHLAGVHIPSLRRDCQTTDCMPQAVRMLRSKASGFVHCTNLVERRGGSLEGFCSVAGRGVLDPRTDLGAWLIEQGLALANDRAPPEYVSLEQLAKAQGRGLWADLSGYWRRHH
jgi:endonuclease YncB( thermonuclease family)